MINILDTLGITIENYPIYYEQARLIMTIILVLIFLNTGKWFFTQLMNVTR